MNRPLAVMVALVALAIPRLSSAQLASRPADEWIRTLDSPARIASLKIPEVVAALKVAPGQHVADIGSGTGLFSFPLARAITPGGTVYAVDINKALVEYVSAHAREQGLTNVQGVVGQPDDPVLPAPVDLALISDVLHHVENRAVYLKALAGDLTPGGRIAIIEFIPAQSPHRADPTLVVSEEQATAWMAAAGLTPVEHVTLFTDRWFVIYGRP
jgi:ubiquinone/menaquinone biosynthesis C-methylase UbiE